MTEVSTIYGSLLDVVKSSELAGPGNFVLARTLNTVSDEDGPPIAKRLEATKPNVRGSLAPKIGIGFMSVADGLGGAGSRRVETPSGERTQAHVASRTAQSAVKDLLKSTPTVLAGSPEEIRLALEQAFERHFGSLPEVPPSAVRGKLLNREFPTTWSGAVIQELPDGSRKVIICAKGDSPVFIFTPDKIFTTMTPGSGDEPMGDEIICRGNYSLRVCVKDFPPGMPVIVATSTDGIID